MKSWLWLTAFSPSHQGMMESHFLPSFQKYLEADCSLSIKKLDYHCGNFGEASFNEMGRKQVHILADEVRKNLGIKMVVSGCDFRFYSSFMPEVEHALVGHDIVGINDVYGPVCGDFLAFTASERIASLFDWIAIHDHHFPNEQLTLNAGIQNLGISVALLPDRFWTFGLQYGTPWEPSMEVLPPVNIALHHANFTIGSKNKEALLKAVYERHNAQSNYDIGKKIFEERNSAN
jgi:hypothetical protein